MSAGRPLPFVLIETPAAVGRDAFHAAGASGLLFQNPRDVIVCRAPGEIPAALERLDAERAAGRSVAGYVAYEAAEAWSNVRSASPSPVGALSKPDASHAPSLPLLYMLVCDAPTEVSVPEFLQSTIDAESDAFARYPGGYRFRTHPDAQLKAAESTEATPENERDLFAGALARIEEHLAAGECYQVNYTRNTDFAFAGDPCALYERLRRLQPTAYSALICFEDSENTGLVESENEGEGESNRKAARAILSLSPELFFEYGPAAAAEDDFVLQTRPMKGTAPRYRDPELDRESREFLARDPKNLAEHRMIVDLLRNDLGVHARLGGVDLPEMLALESHDTVHQMTSLVRARLAPETNAQLFQKIFPALFPCGSITGAPKLAARKIIDALEAQPRGIYTGAIGYATPEKARFNVAIRSLAIDGERARYGSGCGIVWDSEADAEWEEYRLKQAFLRPALDDFALIETILFDGAAFVLLDEHCDRLRASAAHYHIAWDEQGLLDLLNESRRRNSGRALRVRATVDRSGRCAVQTAAWSDAFQELARDLRVADGGKFATEAEPVAIRLAEDRVYSGDPFRRHKTTERELYDRELQAAREAGFHDSLFLNERGEVVESAIANLLIHTPEDEWLTPAVDCGALPGVFLAGLDGRYPGEVRRVRLSLDEAWNAGRWYLVNSLRGARPVRCESSAASLASSTL